jgi:phosphoglycolate phosphatase-like HAD superfamily hydrolase
MRDSLLLWDIDGTLVDTARAGERALLRLARDLYQRDFGEQLPVALAGRTDTSIMGDLLRHLEVEATAETTLGFQKSYLALLEQTLPTGKARLHPGIQEALEAIHAHPEIHQALLTGNLREGARLKLSHLDIWKYFEFGAFADDSSDRNELGPFALRRAKESLGLDFPPVRVFVIGDTPHDIACGQAIGARTIAVATGAFSVAELSSHHPTHVFPDLSDTKGLLGIVLG